MNLEVTVRAVELGLQPIDDVLAHAASDVRVGALMLRVEQTSDWMAHAVAYIRDEDDRHRRALTMSVLLPVLKGPQLAELITAWVTVLEPHEHEWLLAYAGRFIRDWEGFLPILLENVDGWFGKHAWRVRRAVMRYIPLDLQTVALAPPPKMAFSELLATFHEAEWHNITMFADAPPVIIRAGEANRLRLLEAAVGALPKVVTGWPDGDDNEDRSTALAYIAPYLPRELAEEAHRVVMESMKGGRWKVYGLCSLHHHGVIDVIDEAMRVWQSGEPTYVTQIVGREYEILAMAPYIKGAHMDVLLDYLLSVTHPMEADERFGVAFRRGKEEAIGVLAPNMDEAQARRVLGM